MYQINVNQSLYDNNNNNNQNGEIPIFVINPTASSPTSVVCGNNNNINYTLSHPQSLYIITTMTIPNISIPNISQPTTPIIQYSMPSVLESHGQIIQNANNYQYNHHYNNINNNNTKSLNFMFEQNSINHNNNVYNDPFNKHKNNEKEAVKNERQSEMDSNKKDEGNVDLNITEIKITKSIIKEHKVHLFNHYSCSYCYV